MYPIVKNVDEDTVIFLSSMGLEGNYRNEIFKNESIGNIDGWSRIGMYPVLKGARFLQQRK